MTKVVKQAAITEIVSACDKILQPELFRDYCPNGLQVLGKTQIQRIVSGVTACQALLDAAIERDADLILVHHGYFWKGDSPVLTGIHHKRIKTLLGANLNLLAYHLPLDAHPKLGNNAQLAKALGWATWQPLPGSGSPPLGFLHNFEKPYTLSEITLLVEQTLLRKPLVISAGVNKISKIAWCSGAAQNYIEAAHAAGAECFISGEISERTVHFAREAQISYLAAGHHATERLGVQALGQKLAKDFSLDHEYIEIDNPV